MPSWPGVFRLGVFLSVAFSEFRSMSASGSNSFFKLFIHSAFWLCSLRFHIIPQNASVSFASGG